MLTPLEIRSGLASGLRFLMFDSRGAGYFAPNWNAAWRSFYVLLLLLPASAAMGWYAHLPYYAKYEVDPASFVMVRLLVDILLVAPILGLQYLFAKSQQCQQHFPVLIAANNWFAVVTLFVFFLPWLATTFTFLPDHTRTTIGSLVFIVALIYGWFIAWRVMQVNPFAAVAFPLIPSLLSTVSSDATNYFFFGVARPFFAQ
jgi:hypothetical protein